MDYTKYITTWITSSVLSSKAFNHIETQWDCIKDDVDVHNHDSIYYTTQEANLKFFYTLVYEEFDADKLDGMHAADIIGGMIPVGGILIWQGAEVDIPENYVKCDGSTMGDKVTPDLRNKFVICAGDTYTVDATGGTNNNVNPTGVITVGAHTLTTAEIPNHRHQYIELSNIAGPDHQIDYGHAYGSTQHRDISATNQETGGGSHGHSGSSISFNSITPLPPYYSLIYIMKYQ
jgi:hypothetical protein